MKKVDVYEIDQHKQMDKDVARLVRKKKFLSLPIQLKELESPLSEGDFPGELISRRTKPVPHDIYKLRLPNLDTKVGKSNGYRVFYVVVMEQRIVVFLTIYYKKEDEIVTDAYVDGLINGYFLDTLPYEDNDDSVGV